MSKSPRKIVKKDKQEKQEKKDSIIFERNFPLVWKYTDLDVRTNFVLLVVFRIILALFFTYTTMDADEYWQAT